MNQKDQRMITLDLDFCGSMPLPDVVKLGKGGTNTAAIMASVLHEFPVSVHEPSIIMMTDGPGMFEADVSAVPDNSGHLNGELVQAAAFNLQRALVIGDVHHATPLPMIMSDGYKVKHYGVRAPKTTAEKITYSHKRKQRAMRKNRK